MSVFDVSHGKTKTTRKKNLSPKNLEKLLTLKKGGKNEKKSILCSFHEKYVVKNLNEVLMAKMASFPNFQIFRKNQVKKN